MMKRLGGGSLFKHELNKDDVSWLIVTEINTSQGFSALEVEIEIQKYIRLVKNMVL